MYSEWIYRHPIFAQKYREINVCNQIIQMTSRNFFQMRLSISFALWIIADGKVSLSKLMKQSFAAIVFLQNGNIENVSLHFFRMIDKASQEFTSLTDILPKLMQLQRIRSTQLVWDTFYNIWSICAKIIGSLWCKRFMVGMRFPCWNYPMLFMFKKPND